jgi:hypothetical protein
MLRDSRMRPRRALTGAAVLLAGCCLFGAGCQRYATREAERFELALETSWICAPVEVTAPRPEGLLDETRVTAAAPGEPVLAFDNALPGAPAEH